jgi:hypothetical protein
MAASTHTSVVLLIALSALVASFYTSGLTQALIELSAFLGLIALVIRNQN